MLKPGGNVDCWCGKCKMLLAHTIEAMVGEKPARVQCNTCKAQHGYKATAPKEATGKPRTRAPGKGRATRYETLIKGKNAGSPKRYSSSDTYESGDVVEHPTFGVGAVTGLRDTTKIEVLFDGGLKILIHRR
jgi:hypothetical protein